MTGDPAPDLVCFGCGTRVEPGEPFPFRCRNAHPGDDVDHLLRPVGVETQEAGGAAARCFRSAEPNPFLRYRTLLYGYRRARSLGLDDDSLVEVVADLDRGIAAVDGHGFRVTPFAPADQLAAALGLGAGRLWIKDETGNVAGSHKARHLVGIELWLGARRRLEARPDDRPLELAIASCGNAALAAAVVARGAGDLLQVFVPPDANPAVIRRLQALGVELTTCPRRPGEAGDPCVLRFRETVAAQGALPFSCQGSDNGLAIDGGQTLVWEMASQLLAAERQLDRLLVQVGGGALASACIAGLLEAQRLGIVARLPRIHAVQTVGCSPLHRAWRRLAERLAERHLDVDSSSCRGVDDRQLAELVRPVLWSRTLTELHWAAAHRSHFMWPWEEVPHSLASGILDDETYDWVAVVEGLLRTGGWPLVVDEATVRSAHDLARRHTGIAVEPTGSAGLAGLLELGRQGAIGRDETTAVLFTGAAR